MVSLSMFCNENGQLRWQYIFEYPTHAILDFRTKQETAEDFKMAVCQQSQINQFHCQQPPLQSGLTWTEYEANLQEYEEQQVSKTFSLF